MFLNLICFAAKHDVKYRIFTVQGHPAARPAFESVLAAADARLHPMHVIAFDSLMPLVNCCRHAGDGAGAIKHLSRMLDTMDAICGLSTVEVRSPVTPCP